MKSMLMAVVSLALALATQAAQANPELAKARNCMTCHAPASQAGWPFVQGYRGQIRQRCRRRGQAGGQGAKGQHRCMGTGSDAGQSPNQ